MITFFEKNHKILQNFAKFQKKIEIFYKILEILDNFTRFIQKIEFRAMQKCANLEDLEKC